MTRLSLAIGTILVFATTPALACEQADAAKAAVETKDAVTAEALHQQLVLDPTCSEEFKDWVGAYLAKAYQGQSAAPGMSMTARQDALAKSFAYQKHWRTLAISGQLYWDAREYENAARTLDVALGLVAEGDPSHTITEDEFRKLHGLYTQSLALASTAVEGKNIFRSNFRNFVVEEVPSQITFKFNSTEFDQKGLGFATKLLEHVLTHQPARIELDGHTDPKGPDGYNLILSVARAEAVKTFLSSNGYDGEIVVRGFGESQLPPPPEGYEEGSEEHYQIARRVTFREG